MPLRDIGGECLVNAIEEVPDLRGDRPVLPVAADQPRRLDLAFAGVLPQRLSAVGSNDSALAVTEVILMVHRRESSEAAHAGLSLDRAAERNYIIVSIRSSSHAVESIASSSSRRRESPQA
jgi:hypothetical protein